MDNDKNQVLLEKLKNVKSEISKAVLGKDEIIDKILTVVIAGGSVDMDVESNSGSLNADIAAGSYKDITYIIDPRAFTADTELTGTIWSASIEEDRSYRLKIN